MANYYASARSNYVRLKDAEAEAAFRNLENEYAVTVITRKGEDGRDYFGLLGNSDDGDGWNFTYSEAAIEAMSVEQVEAALAAQGAYHADEDDPEDDEDALRDELRFIQVDASTIIAPLLADDAVFVMQEAGAEKLRYLVGYAVAFDRTGEMVSLHLNDIYRLARDKFGPDAEITQATY